MTIMRELQRYVVPVDPPADAKDEPSLWSRPGKVHCVLAIDTERWSYHEWSEKDERLVQLAGGERRR